MSDFEILRPRDSASISATSGSGSRTVIVFMDVMYYTPVKVQYRASSAHSLASFGNARSRLIVVSFKCSPTIASTKPPDSQPERGLDPRPLPTGRRATHLPDHDGPSA